MPNRITTHVDLNALMRLGSDPAGPIFRHMVSRGADVESAAKRNASGAVVKVRSGNLRSSIHTETPEMREGRIVVAVTADAAYALAVHEGTRPHDIVPKTKRVLAWQGPAGPVFSRRVHHPGTKPKPFLDDALNVVR